MTFSSLVHSAQKLWHQGRGLIKRGFKHNLNQQRGYKQTTSPITAALICRAMQHQAAARERGKGFDPSLEIQHQSCCLTQRGLILVWEEILLLIKGIQEIFDSFASKIPSKPGGWSVFTHKLNYLFSTRKDPKRSAGSASTASALSQPLCLHLRHKRLHWIDSVSFFSFRIRWYQSRQRMSVSILCSKRWRRLSSLCASWYSKWMKQQQSGGQIKSGYQTMPQHWRTHTVSVRVDILCVYASHM